MEEYENGTIASINSNKMEQVLEHLAIWDSPRVLHLVCHVLSQTLGNFLLAGIIWFEEYGGMDQYKTVLNQITGHMALMLLTGNVHISRIELPNPLIGLFSCRWRNLVQRLHIHDVPPGQDGIWSL